MPFDEFTKAIQMETVERIARIYKDAYSWYIYTPETTPNFYLEEDLSNYLINERVVPQIIKEFTTLETEQIQQQQEDYGRMRYLEVALSIALLTPVFDISKLTLFALSKASDSFVRVPTKLIIFCLWPAQLEIDDIHVISSCFQYRLIEKIPEMYLHTLLTNIQSSSGKIDTELSKHMIEYVENRREMYESVRHCLVQLEVVTPKMKDDIIYESSSFVNDSKKEELPMLWNRATYARKDLLFLIQKDESVLARLIDYLIENYKEPVIELEALAKVLAQIEPSSALPETPYHLTRLVEKDPKSPVLTQVVGILLKFANYQETTANINALFTNYLEKDDQLTYVVLRILPKLELRTPQLEAKVFELAKRIKTIDEDYPILNSGFHYVIDNSFYAAYILSLWGLLSKDILVATYQALNSETFDVRSQAQKLVNTLENNSG